MTRDLLLVAHFFGLFLGGAPGVGMAVLAATMGKVPSEQRPALLKATEGLRLAGKLGMVLLVATGVVLTTMDGVWGAGIGWFWIKLAAVAALIVGIVLAERAGAAAIAGDARSQARASMFGKMNLLSLVVVLLAASFAFH